jgi:hypothetical protein
VKQITTYHNFKSEYGLVSVIVNCVDKWLDYSIEETAGIIRIRFFNAFDDLIETETIDISDYLDTEREFRYIMLHDQNKDQIYIYFIPSRLVKGDKWIDHVKNVINKNVQK